MGLFFFLRLINVLWVICLLNLVALMCFLNLPGVWKQPHAQRGRAGKKGLTLSVLELQVKFSQRSRPQATCFLWLGKWEPAAQFSCRTFTSCAQKHLHFVIWLQWQKLQQMLGSNPRSAIYQTLGPWISHSLSLTLSFFVCDMGTIIEIFYKLLARIKYYLYST